MSTALITGAGRGLGRELARQYTAMGGAGAPLAPEASVSGLRQVISSLKPADSGRFLSHDGSPIPG